MDRTGWGILAYRFVDKVVVVIVDLVAAIGLPIVVVVVAAAKAADPVVVVVAVVATCVVPLPFSGPFLLDVDVSPDREWVQGHPPPS